MDLADHRTDAGVAPLAEEAVAVDTEETHPVATKETEAEAVETGGATTVTVRGTPATTHKDKGIITTVEILAVGRMVVPTTQDNGAQLNNTKM